MISKKPRLPEECHEKTARTHKDFSAKLKSLFPLSLGTKIIAIICCLVVMGSLSSSAWLLNDYVLTTAERRMFSADVVTRSLSSKLQKQSFTPSVSYNLSLVYASVELDLSVTVVDEFGEIVTGFPFEITITSSDGHPVTEIDGDKDGQIYFDGLAEGDYSVQLAPASGYIIPAAPVVATVQPKVTFERVDVSDKIVQSDTINKADEDKQFGGNNGADSGTSTLPTSNTVEFVESSSKKETKTTEKPLLDANGKPVIKYTASLSPEGFLLLANGTASSLKAVMDNGFLVGATKTATAAAAAAAHRGGFIVSPLSTTAPAAGAASSGGGTTPVTPPPTDPVVPPVEPPVEPPVDPPVEPPTPPATVTVTYDLANGVLVARDKSENIDIKTGYKVTAVPQTQTVTETVTTYYGWQTLNGTTYYFDKTGKKVTGWQVIQNVTYFFTNEGARGGSMGIDISEWQESVNWSKVKAAGIDFVFLRVGFRGYGSGRLIEDGMFKTHAAGAIAAGIKVGVYFFTQAINEQEAVEEASMCLQLVAGYKIDYPIAIDIEYAAWNARTNGMNNAQRTKVCVAFCETIRNAGYKAAVYANKYYFTSMLNTSQLESYVIWLAHYTEQTSYARRYDIWQYTSTAKVNGIPGGVDMNISYLGY